MQKFVCCICKQTCTGWGNNPYPVSKREGDKCCDDCNTAYVVPARIRNFWVDKQEDMDNGKR